MVNWFLISLLIKVNAIIDGYIKDPPKSFTNNKVFPEFSELVFDFYLFYF